ncbi:MAG: hypothetical protein VBE63_21130 [Lamprobacter sp.]|uniref:hypothetical protein n=1 Tax=Lamprobacter sp. TaxID=3100796 RepID=UPI002B257554|nr:hypothetical protein [Lamprobacter sp.]MEA3642424.1 hypothetical protein [Lamprobacter sp.]
MAEPDIDWAPLPLNFPQDFLPDRALLSRLLPFAAKGGEGTKVDIGAETGIPTGKSTGKVEPMIHYARGMGLIAATKSAGRWSLRLSALGELVFAEDRFLDEPVTLWLLHLLLCRPAVGTDPVRGIADAWFALFADGGMRLGNPFRREDYLAFLTERHGPLGYLRPLSGLVPRSYTEAACLGPIDALAVVAGGGYRRQPAPDRRALYPAYSLALFLAWDHRLTDQDQVALDQLFTQSRLLDVLGWDQSVAGGWVNWMTDRGLLRLDRLTGSSVALRTADTAMVIADLYDELV